MTDKRAIQAMAIPEHKAKSLYPEPFASLVKHRTRRRLGDHFGLANFGVNLTTLAPGATSCSTTVRWTLSISRWGTGCQGIPSTIPTTIWPWYRVPMAPGQPDTRMAPPTRGGLFAQ